MWPKQKEGGETKKRKVMSGGRQAVTLGEFSLHGMQCSQPSSPSVFGGGRDGLWLVVRLFWGARTDYARQGKDRTDYRGL